MTAALATDELRRLCDLVAPVDVDGPPGLPDPVLAGLSGLVECDVVSFTDMDVQSRTMYVDQDFDGHDVVSAAPYQDEDGLFWEHYWAAASCSYPSRTGDHRSVTMRDDFYSDRQWHATGMYQDVFRDSGLERDLLCPLGDTGTRSCRVIFFRGPGRPFDDHDRMVMALLRPHLAELVARRGATTTEPGLTRRQVELLRLVAAGCSTAQIAELLFLSPATVRKHLENAFGRLGVTNRTAAVVRAFGRSVTPGTRTWLPANPARCSPGQPGRRGSRLRRERVVV